MSKYILSIKTIPQHFSFRYFRKAKNGRSTSEAETLEGANAKDFHKSEPLPPHAEFSKTSSTEGFHKGQFSILLQVPLGSNHLGSGTTLSLVMLDRHLVTLCV